MPSNGHGAAPREEAQPSRSITGGGLVGVVTPLSSSDVIALQSVASKTNLIVYLTQFGDLSGSNATTQQTGTSILNDTRHVDLALDEFAANEAVTLPSGFANNYVILAQAMIAGVQAGSADQTFTKLIVAAEASEFMQFDHMAHSATDPAVRAFAASVLPTVQSDLAAARGTITLPPVSNVPSSATLNSSNLSTLETYNSVDSMEVFLGELSGLVTKNYGILQYSDKLVIDHGQANVTIGNCAAASGTYLPAAISSGNAPMAQMIIAALPSAKTKSSIPYDRVFLEQMIMGHTQALQFTRQVIMTTQNPAVKQFAIDIAPTIYIHRLVALALLRPLPG
jgi:putative membrane protein